MKKKNQSEKGQFGRTGQHQARGRKKEGRVEASGVSKKRERERERDKSDQETSEATKVLIQTPKGPGQSSFPLHSLGPNVGCLVFKL